MKRLLFLLFLSQILYLISQISFAQNDTSEYFTHEFQRNSDFIYKENINTVLLHREGYELSNPVITLNSEEKLKLSFDDLDPELKSYSYFIVHCNAGWQPSELLPSEYIQGVQEDYINDYQYSRNTIFKFIHYNVVFPNSNFSITKSGNYLLKAYLDNKENIVFTKRFMVNENKATITAGIHPSSNIDERMYKQEVDFNILNDVYQITNPYRDLKVTLLQNFRWDNAITDLKPTFVKDNELIYDYGDENIFPGGNEFRHFDFSNFRFITDRIDSIVFHRDGNHVYLLPDEKMAYKGYISKQDLNGRRVVRIEGNRESEIDADYAWVHFSFPYPENLSSGTVYIMGDLTGWNFISAFRMNYYRQEQRYEQTLFLKQGYYNYIYVFVPDGKSAGDATIFEGSHAQTENDYTILVYHRSYGDNYDRLISFGTFNSLR